MHPRTLAMMMGCGFASGFLLVLTSQLPYEIRMAMGSVLILSSMGGLVMHLTHKNSEEEPKPDAAYE